MHFAGKARVINHFLKSATWHRPAKACGVARALKISGWRCIGSDHSLVGPRCEYVRLKTAGACLQLAG